MHWGHEPLRNFLSRLRPTSPRPKRRGGQRERFMVNSRREARLIEKRVRHALVDAGGSFLIAVKLPSSQQRTNPSVTDFNSSQRARIVFASCLVIWLSVAAVAMTASRSANSWTIWLVAGIK